MFSLERSLHMVARGLDKMWIERYESISFEDFWLVDSKLTFLTTISHSCIHNHPSLWLSLFPIHNITLRLLNCLHSSRRQFQLSFNSQLKQLKAWKSWHQRWWQQLLALALFSSQPHFLAKIGEPMSTLLETLCLWELGNTPWYFPSWSLSFCPSHFLKFYVGGGANIIGFCLWHE